MDVVKKQKGHGDTSLDTAVSLKKGERIWGYDSEGDSSVVAEHIRRIRTKIAAYTDHMYVETVWGCGYKWVK